MTKPRLAKLMSQRGICSRREADRFIEQGLVLVDGEQVTTLGTRIDSTQNITLVAAARAQQSDLATVLVNKPVGYVSGLAEKGYPAAVRLVTDANRYYPRETTPSRHGLAPAGRLDIDSIGLLVFTQDGRIAKQLIGTDSSVEKEYLVWVQGDLTESKLTLLQHGLSLDDRPLRAAQVECLRKHSHGTQLRFTLTEGRKRQIRRMCEQLDLRVSRLWRTRIGHIKLGALKSGMWRRLLPHETF